MAIVNRTPDSFYDRGATFTDEAAKAAAHRVIDEGADVVDVGGVKAGPGSTVDADEEIARVVPFIEWLRAAYPDQLISVDTWRAAVAKQACAAGRRPDQRHLGRRRSRPARGRRRVRRGPGLFPHRRRGAADPPVPGQLRHLRARCGRRRHRRGDRGRRTRRRRRGARDAMLIDPTHDFGKNTYHGLSLLRHVKDLVKTGWPVLMALSNKDFVGETLGVGLTERLEGTLAATALAAADGARDVPGARGRAHTTRAGDGRVDPGRAATDAHGEGTGMTLILSGYPNCPAPTSSPVGGWPTTAGAGRRGRSPSWWPPRPVARSRWCCPRSTRKRPSEASSRRSRRCSAGLSTS